MFVEFVYEKEFQCLDCGRISLYLRTSSGVDLVPICTICPKATYDPKEWECVDNMDQEYRDLYPLRKKLLGRR